MGYESIARGAEYRMGYSLRGHEGERNWDCKNGMVHFSNEIVVIVITCRSLDIFVIH